MFYLTYVGGRRRLIKILLAALSPREESETPSEVPMLPIHRKNGV